MSRRRSIFLVTLAAGALVVGAVAPAAHADPPPQFTATALTPSGAPVDGAKTSSGSLAESDPALIARNDSARVAVMVKVDVDPVASYRGGVDGYAATSPEVTGKAFSTSDPAVKAYTAYVDKTIAAAAAAIVKAAPSAKVLSTYNVAYGGISLTVKASEAKKVLAVRGVAAVQSNALRSVPTSAADSVSRSAAAIAAPAAAPASATAKAAPKIDNDATTFIGADAVWPSLGGRDRAGAGVIVGVLDTGIWPEHPMLADKGLARPAGGPWKCDFGLVGDAAFSCNNKLLGAYAFLNAYTAFTGAGLEDFCDGDVCSARDSDGHGTHTATTAAGDYVANAPIFGVDRGPISGIAPGASVIAYRVCGPEGCYSSDSAAAVQQAIKDGVDVINFSISGGGSPYTDPVELAFLDAFAAGITVNASAGNAGPGAGTSDHAGPWVTTVAASTFDRAFSSTLTLTASGGATYSKSGTTLTAGVSGKPVVLATAVPGYAGGILCQAPFAAGSLTGKVVVCARGGNGRVEKGFFATQGGAAGLILYNPTAMDTESDNHFLPAIHLEGPNDDLLAFLAGHTGVTATWAAGGSTKAKGDVMAGFSSRGPLGDFAKPDVTAPGVQVLAGHTPKSTDQATGPQGELYQAIAGTSMSSPHATGVSTLVKAAHPSWTPGQIKSALMTSSLQSVVNVDGTPAGVFDRGSGSIRADRAVSPSLTISETAANFAAGEADAQGRLGLNIPSVNVDPLPGASIVKRTVTNVSGSTLTFTAKGSNVGKLEVIATPLAFTLKPGASKQITILVNGIQATDGWHFGQVTLTPTKKGANPVVIPVVADVGDAAIALTQSCTPTEIARGATTVCTVAASSTLPVAVNAKIDVVANPLLQVTKVTAPAKKQLLGATWSGTLAAALPPKVQSVAPGDGFGYIPLDAFAGSATPTPIGDEQSIGFNVPAFRYGGEPYTQIRVVSNGYLILGNGTGTAADVQFEPTGIPNPASPNNIIAPWWTDLDGTGAPGIFVNVLTDGVNDYIVAEWRVHSYGQVGDVKTFQVWLQAGAVENNWFTYDPAMPTSAPDPLLIGAENRDGTSGVTVPSIVTTENYVVTTTPPTAGGTVTFDYTLKGLLKGTWSTVATLQSSALNVIPVEETKIKVK